MKDLTGLKIGNVTVLSLFYTNGKDAGWLCKCKCGRKEVRNHFFLLAGLANSCGCERWKRIRKETLYKRGLNMKKITAEEYADVFSETELFAAFIDAAHWAQEFDTEEVWDWMLREAKHDGIELTQIEEFDYDNYFREVYTFVERGLS